VVVSQNASITSTTLVSAVRLVAVNIIFLLGVHFPEIISAALHFPVPENFKPVS
jgi:hypothetical protein